MYSYKYPTTSTSSGVGTFGIIALIIALAAAIVIYCVFMPKSNEKNLNNVTKKIYDFLHFKKFYIAEFLKIAYIFSALFLTIISFEFISTSFGLFFCLLVFGNILLRIIFEASLLLYRMYDNIKEINDKTK